VKRFVLVVATLVVAACGANDPAGSTTPSTSSPVTAPITSSPGSSTTPSTAGPDTTAPSWAGPPGTITRTWVEDGRLLAEVVDNAGATSLASSTDGIAWTEAATPPPADAAGPVVSFGGEVLRFTTITSERCTASTSLEASPDGEAWTSVDPGPLDRGTVMAAAANDAVLVVAWMESHSADEEACDDPRPITVFVSEDGRTFTPSAESPATFDLGHLGSIDDVIWTGTLFMMAGSDLSTTTFWYAFDGQSWTRHDAPLPDHVYGVDLLLWDDTVLAVGSMADSGALAGWRSDGNRWERLALPELAWSANVTAWDGGLAIMDATGEPAFHLSTDAETWTRVVGTG
jgi:hypothetical protein